MATKRMSILGRITPDTTGNVYEDLVSNHLTLTNAKDTPVIVMTDPGGTGDTGFEGRFTVPKDYVGTPVLVIRYIIDGTPASVVAFGVQLLARADSEAFDTAYGSENIASNSTWTGYADEDQVEETISISDTLAVDDDVYYSFFIDDNVHTFTGNVLITDLLLQYEDA